MLKFICYPKCTTCQKAKKWLDDNGIECKSGHCGGEGEIGRG